MTKLSTFKVFFNNPAAVYFGGQSVIGSVVLVLSGPMKMRQLYLNFSGKAKVKWTERLRHGREGREDYVAKEHYMRDRIIILMGSDNSALTLPAGSYQYPFSYTLPTKLPSSYEGGIGFVRYSVEAVIDKPWRLDHKVCLAFTVVDYLDLNLEPPNWREPHEAEITTKESSCCFSSGNVMAKFAIEKRLFVPGENVVIISAVIENRSNRVIDHSRISLRQVVEFRAKRKFMAAASYNSRVVSKVIGEIRDATPIPPNQQRVLNNSTICIPQVVPSRMDGCSIINVSYFIELHSSNGVDVSIGIVIGSVPLIGNNNGFTLTAQPQRQPAPQFATSGASHYESHAVSAPAPPPYGGYNSGQWSNFVRAESAAFDDAHSRDDGKFRTIQASQ